MTMEETTKRLIPVKAHFFFFFAAMGPILPQVNVFGRQLGISPQVMGIVTCVLPIMWAVAKPSFGLLVDYFRNQRKLIFMLLILAMSTAYCSMCFLPETPFVIQKEEYADEHMPRIVDFSPKPYDHFVIKTIDSMCDKNKGSPNFCDKLFNKASCNWICNEKIINNNSDSDIAYPLEFLKSDNFTIFDTIYVDAEEIPECSNLSLLDATVDGECIYNNNCNLSCAFAVDNYVSDYQYYSSGIFWAFIVMVCIGTVGFNVASCISDAICFDVLGPNLSTKYGWQRAWGTIGYGLTALISGFLVDYFSASSDYKNFTPAFVIVLIFTVADLCCCTKLKLPSMEKPKNIKRELGTLLRQPKILIFLCFAVIAGTLDSFIVDYMFWFVEELALETGHMGNIKLLEGLTVAAESFGGELLFFAVSGKILRRIGFGTSLTLCLMSYGIRMFLISFITNPWYLIGIELVMQGPTYALTYATIVGYAAAVAPEGLSATLQGIVAGMDDGVGFVFGALVGGLLLGSVGGRVAFRFFASFAFLAAAAHAILQTTVLKNINEKPSSVPIRETEMIDMKESLNGNTKIGNGHTENSAMLEP